MKIFLLVDTDNFGGDYPNEKFIADDSLNLKYTGIEVEALSFTLKENAQAAADDINARHSEHYPRYIKVVESGYKLQPGFEP